MKAALFLALTVCAALFGDFKTEFLDEVMAFSSMHPEEMVEEQKAFVEHFYAQTVRQERGLDSDLRPLFVTAQGDFERAMTRLLKEGKIKEILGFIHTPTPATPFCTKGEISEGLIDESLMGDERRLYSVMKRPDILRAYLESGGMLGVCYPENGRDKRTAEQLAIFDEAKEKFAALKDIPLHVEEMESELIGATYLFKAYDGERYAFSIQSKQANAPEDGALWGMWFGSGEDPEVLERIGNVIIYINQSK